MRLKPGFELDESLRSAQRKKIPVYFGQKDTRIVGVVVFALFAGVCSCENTGAQDFASEKWHRLINDELLETLSLDEIQRRKIRQAQAEFDEDCQKSIEALREKYQKGDVSRKS